MLQITEEFINATAPNQSAINNGWALVKNNSFENLGIAPDETALFGECKGSGSKNYIVSVDFAKPESPVFRCTCPSRQFPCKHALGLLYAYVSGKSFDSRSIPDDVLEKRQKLVQRDEKKKEQTEIKPRKVNQSALVKKLDTQIEGLAVLEKIIASVAQAGLGTINEKTRPVWAEQAKQLGNYYIPGAQIAFKEFLLLFQKNKDPEPIYTEAIEQLVMLHALCKKGRDYLQKRRENPAESLQSDLLLEELLGHSWQLSELKDHGLVEQDAELVQLSFDCLMSEARQEYVDSGVWLNLTSGKVQVAHTYRPYKAKKHIKEEDSFFPILQIQELFVYPGEINCRIRWENSTLRNIEPADYARMKSHAQKSLTSVIKTVKNQIKNPLAVQFPLVLLQFSRIMRVGDQFVLEDEAGQRLVLADKSGGREERSCFLLELVPAHCLVDQVMLVEFHHHPDAHTLQAQPLSLITDDAIIRCRY